MDELFEMLSSLLGFAVSIGIVVTAVNSAKKKQQKKQAQQTLKQAKMEPTAASMKVMGTPERTPPRAKSAQTPARTRVWSCTRMDSMDRIAPTGPTRRM